MSAPAPSHGRVWIDMGSQRNTLSSGCHPEPAVNGREAVAESCHARRRKALKDMHGSPSCPEYPPKVESVRTRVVGVTAASRGQDGIQ